MGANLTSKNVLLAIDGSKNAERAFHWFVANTPEVKNDQLILFHNLTPPSNLSVNDDGDLDFDVTDMEIDIKKLKLEAENLESYFMNECEKSQLSCRWINKWGKPKYSILKAVDRYHADLVVMGSRGLRSLSSALLGSVSNYVLHHVKVPVIIVPSRLNNNA